VTRMKLEEVLKVTGAQDWNEAIVRLGFGPQFGLPPDYQILDFTVRLSKPGDIRRIVSQVNFGNDWKGGDPLAEVLAALVEYGTVMYIEFGRRNGEVLHVYMRNPQADRETMMDLLKRYEPDELDEYGPYGIRAWWD